MAKMTWGSILEYFGDLPLPNCATSLSLRPPQEDVWDMQPVATGVQLSSETKESNKSQTLHCFSFVLDVSQSPSDNPKILQQQPARPTLQFLRSA